MLSWSADAAVQVSPIGVADVLRAARERLAGWPEARIARGREGDYGTLR